MKVEKETKPKAKKEGPVLVELTGEFLETRAMPDDCILVPNAGKTLSAEQIRTMQSVTIMFVLQHIHKHLDGNHSIRGGTSDEFAKYDFVRNSWLSKPVTSVSKVYSTYLFFYYVNTLLPFL